MALRLHSTFSVRNWLSGGAHFFIIGVAAQADTPAVWPYALLAMSGVSFIAWIANYRRLRRLTDTPLSNIASAAQGYVEISGRAAAGSPPVLSRLTHLPCLWYQFEVHEKSSDDNWTLTDSGTSDAPFVLIDDTGRCIVDPRGAEIVTTHEQTWTSGSYRYTERLLLAQERIYGLGEFATIGGAGDAADVDGDISKLLAGWKQDQSSLLQRFDLNRDGRIDLQEWELARRQARREVEAARLEKSMAEGTHTLRQPQDGRLFLLSNYLPDRLQASYARWAWAHAIICIGASGTAVALF